MGAKVSKKVVVGAVVATVWVADRPFAPNQTAQRCSYPGSKTPP